MKTRFLTFSLLAASVLAGTSFLALPSAAVATDIDNGKKLPQDVSYYKSTVNVWDVMQDSRKVRSLKTADENIRKAFDETLRKDYADIQKKVLDHLKSDPRYKDARLAFHEFRTPGAEAGSINADMDGRVLIEKSPGGEWIEIDRREWQDTMNKAIAEKTGYTGKRDSKSLQDHAATYRQLATDQYHVEASRDYADQTKALKQVRQKNGILRWTVEQSSTVRQMRDEQTGELKFEKDGTPMFESESHLVKVKSAPDNSNLKLKDSEGLALMYYEKGNEQFRQFETARALGDQDKAAMHLSESAVQMGKQAKTLKSMRDSYERRGFDVGTLPDNMQKAMDEIVKFKGDLESNPLALNKKIQDLGYRDLDDFNRKMGGQLESLKLAAPKKMVSPSSDLIDFHAHIKTPHMARSGGTRVIKSASTGHNTFSKVKDVINFYESVEQIRKQAKSGQHTFLDIDQDDSALMENIKVYGMALAEISGVPQAMDAGFEADSRAKNRIEQAIREGRAVDPVRETMMVMGEVGTGAIRTVLLSSAEKGIETAKDIYGAAEGQYNEYKAESLMEETEHLHQAVQEKAVERELAFGTISSIAKHIGSLEGDLIVAPVTIREPLYFSVMREASWNNAYTAEWEISGAGIAPLRKIKDLGSEDSHYIVHHITDAPSGHYTVKLQIRENASGKIAKNVSTNYEIGGVADKHAGIGTLSGYLEEGSGWLPVSNGGTYKAGQRVKLIVNPQGYWDNTVTAEWSIDGNTLSKGAADQDGAKQVIWTLDDKPHVSLSLRLTKDEKIIAYKDFKLSLAADMDENDSDEKESASKKNKEDFYKESESKTLPVLTEKMARDITSEEKNVETDTTIVVDSSTTPTKANLRKKRGSSDPDYETRMDYLDKALADLDRQREEMKKPKSGRKSSKTSSKRNVEREAINEAMKCHDLEIMAPERQKIDAARAQLDAKKAHYDAFANKVRAEVPSLKARVKSGDLGAKVIMMELQDINVRLGGEVKQASDAFNKLIEPYNAKATKAKEITLAQDYAAAYTFVKDTSCGKRYFSGLDMTAYQDGGQKKDDKKEGATANIGDVKALDLNNTFWCNKTDTLHWPRKIKMVGDTRGFEAVVVDNSNHSAYKKGGTLFRAQGWRLKDPKSVENALKYTENMDELTRSELWMQSTVYYKGLAPEFINGPKDVHYERIVKSAPKASTYTLNISVHGSQERIRTGEGTLKINEDIYVPDYKSSAPSGNYEICQ